MALAWREFAINHRDSGKLQKDWRAHFRDAVRRNRFKLWWCPPAGGCELTTSGVQVKRERGREYRMVIKESRNTAFHRLAHVIGNLLVDNIEAFRDLDAHAALKQLQLESGICCEMVEMDASPVVKAPLDAAETVLGVGARKVLAAVLPEIRTIPVKVAQSLAFDSMEER